MKFLSIILFLACAGCEDPPTKAVPTDVDGYNVRKLFTADGCSVFSFHDGQHRHYFAKCDSEVASVSTHEFCGNGCSREVSISTVLGRLTHKDSGQ